MDAIKLIRVLQNKINSATTADQVLYLSACIENLNLGNVKTVTAYTDLLPLFPKKGEVYFVENEEKLYYGFGNYWYSVLDTTTVINLSWGLGRNGRLGDNTLEDKSSPVSVIGGFPDWVQVDAAWNHTLGLRANGTLYAWGSGRFGQLGDGITITGDKQSPVSVIGGFTDWVQVSAGRYYSLGLRSNGTIWAWGSGTDGQLGTNTAVNRSSPATVVGGLTDWIQVSAGRVHAVGIRANGTLWSWGNNSGALGLGRLGDISTVNKSSPVLVAGGFTNWIQASAGYRHSLGLRATGQLYAWGGAGGGVLGDNTTVNKSSPVLVSGGFSDWTQISTKEDSNFAIRSTGILYSWGSNLRGQLGQSTGIAVDVSSPTSVVGGFTDWVQASIGLNHGLGIRATGQLYSWGSNASGELGQNIVTTTSRSSPVLVAGGWTDWVQTSAGAYHSLGLRIQ
jgi:alpha-tubulin suppressor-like RCC1 family protein